jgi:hypothetical protein
MWVVAALAASGCARLEDADITRGLPAERRAAGAPATDPQAATAVVASAPDEARMPVLLFHRGGGLVGVDEAWTVYADGWVEERDGPAWQAPPAAVAGLLQAAHAADFFGLEDDYTFGSECNDCFVYAITLYANGQAKTITTADGAPDAPEGLQRLVETIGALLASGPEG